MNKIISFIVAMVIAVLGFNDWGKGFTIGAILLTSKGTNFLIYWYMIWKLLHDKNKD